MTVISVLNQKGGSGKTTIATNLARAFVVHGCQTLLVDSDPQGSARDWNEANGGTLVPVVGLDRETLPRDLLAIRGDYEIIIIDGAPQIAKMSAAAIKASDVVLIPVQPSPYDIWACEPLVDLIKQRQDITSDLLKAGFIVSRAIKHTKIAHEIESYLIEYGLPILHNITTQRVGYATSAGQGKTVMDEGVKDRARLEFTELFLEVVKFSGVTLPG